MRRSDEVYSRIARGANRPRNPDKEQIRAAVKFITELPQWSVLLDYLAYREAQRTALSDEGDAGALLRAAGRRTVHRELERLDERVTDDDRSDHSE